MNTLSYRHGILISTGSSFLGRALAVISGIILAKTLTPDLFGSFFGDQALVLLGAGFINLGIGQGYRQIVSRKPELRDSFLFPSLCLRIGAALLYFTGLMVYLDYHGQWRVQTVLVILSTLIFNLMELFQIDLQITRCYTKVSMLILSKELTTFLAALICWRAAAKYDSLVISYFVFALLLAFIGWVIVRPAIASLRTFDYSSLVKTSIPFVAAIFAYAITSFWGVTYIRGVLGDDQAGYYFVPFKAYQIALVLGMSVSDVTLPLYHRLGQSKDFAMFGEVFKRLTRSMWFLGGPIVAICCFMPEFLIRVIANKDYMAAAPIFPWIGFGIIFHLLAIPAGNILESVDKQWYRVAVMAVATILCMLSVTITVPRWGIVGAAWTLFAVDLWLVLGYWLVSRHFARAVVSLRDLFVPCLVLAALLLALSHCPVAVYLRVLLFCALWFGYVMIVADFKKEIIGFLKIFSNRGQ
jgi:O-antigen/teichoic acid export membrane protein